MFWAVICGNQIGDQKVVASGKKTRRRNLAFDRERVVIWYICVHIYSVLNKTHVHTLIHWLIQETRSEKTCDCFGPLRGWCTGPLVFCTRAYIVIRLHQVETRSIAATLHRSLVMRGRKNFKYSNVDFAGKTFLRHHISHRLHIHSDLIVLRCVCVFSQGHPYSIYASVIALIQINILETKKTKSPGAVNVDIVQHRIEIQRNPYIIRKL